MKKAYVLLMVFGVVINFCDLDASANVNSLNQELIESIKDKKPVEEIRRLIEAGEDVGAVDEFGNTALMWAVGSGSEKEVVELLLQAGANVNAVDGNGTTVLIAAAVSGSKEAVELLLQAGADVNVADPMGWTALIAAAASESKEAVELLLQARADVNAASNDGWTALMQAVDSESKETVELLLQAGANVNFVSIDGNTAIDFARSPEIKQMLMRYKALRFIKINQNFDKEPKPEDYISDKAIMPAEATSLESTVAMIDEYDQEYGEQIEAFAKAHANWLRNQLQEAYEPFLYENNSERLLKFFENLQPSLLPEVATFFNSREDFLYVLNELKSHATGETLDRLQKIIANEEHIAKDIAARKIQQAFRKHRKQ